MNKVYKLFIRTITPMHIWGGEDFDIQGFEYVIDQNTVLRFNPGHLLQLLPKGDSDKLLEAANKNMYELRSCVQNIYSENKQAFEKACIYKLNASPGFIKEYREKIMRQGNESNKMLIKAFVKTGSLAYLPGSSIKGALRTAIIYSCSNNAGKPLCYDSRSKYHDNELEGEILEYTGSLDDPFRDVMLRDSRPISPGGMILDKISRPSKKQDTYRKKEAIPQYVELLKKGVMAETEVVIRNNAMNLNGRLAQLAKEFYGKVFKEQANKSDQVASLLNNEKYISNKSVFLLCMGFGSGYSAKKAFPDNMRVSKPKGPFELPQTAWQDENGLPLGWCLCELKEKA